MRILVVSQNADQRGGSDVVAHQSARLLAGRGHVVRMFTPRASADDRTRPDPSHFEQPRALTLGRALYARDAARKLDALLAREAFDVAHLHIYYGTLTAAILAPLRRHGVPIVQHLHEYRSFCSVSVAERAGQPCRSCRVGRYGAGLVNRCNRGSLARSAFSTLEMHISDRLGAKAAPERFLAVSDFQRGVLVGQGLAEGRVHTLHNAVDDRFLTKRADAAPGGRVLYAGRIERYKGVFDLADAAERMPETGFDFIGDGGARAELEVRVAGLRNVRVLGPRPRADLPAHLARALAVVVPSRWQETFGLAAVEAMAQARAVIVTETGGLPEVVEHGVSGLVVPPGDVRALHEALAALVASPARVAALGTAAHARATANFGQERFAASLERHFAAAVSGGRTCLT